MKLHKQVQTAGVLLDSCYFTSTQICLYLIESDKDFSVSQLFDEEFNNQCGVILNDPKSQYVGTWNFTACADRHFLGICQRSVGKSEESK